MAPKGHFEINWPLVSWLFKERIERKRSCFSDDRLKQCARHSIRTTRAARVTRLMRWWRWVPPSKSAALRRSAAAAVSKSAARRRGVGGALNCAFVQCSFAFQSPFHCSFSSSESVQKVTVVYIFYTIYEIRRKVFLLFSDCKHDIYICASILLIGIPMSR